MLTHDPLELFQFKTPAVRHLAWLCQAPQLVCSEHVFEPSAHLPDDYLPRLRHWDNNPANRPDVLNATPHYRLGYYVEALYACLLEHLLGWTILARNLPIRSRGLTLGELDFLVHNLTTGDVEHHEIAIKFYLGYGGWSVNWSDMSPGWYGPNPRDRLDIKTARLLGVQRQRGLMPETSEVLSGLDIAAPQVSRVFMPGYLFYPAATARRLATSSTLATPADVPGNHLRGHWMFVDDVTNSDTSLWVPLFKPHWLGPWEQTEKPENPATLKAMADIAASQTPRLFAALKHNRHSGSWQEIDRIFVTPARWPRPDWPKRADPGGFILQV